MALKIDVDTLRGTREGVPRLAELLGRRGLPATFLFSVGPDHTGRAVRRLFRRGFIGKLRRTSVVANYGLRTLLYGTLLPGPRIGELCRNEMTAVMRQGFDVGLHAYDHVKWQDGVVRATSAWTREQLRLGCEAFVAVFGRPPLVHGAAGWQVNPDLFALQREFGFRLASDTRGQTPFLPTASGVPQYPTTLPTLDELLGRSDLGNASPIDALLALTAPPRDRDHVFTLHAEIEGGTHLRDFERLLQVWIEQGYEFTSLSGLHKSSASAALPRCDVINTQIAGRSGTLAMQSV
ncbi:MAG: 4-deoxy-4-formamido-L-arabinose-phosphoundecaprenol deformylase [Pseudomonadota bacterium]